MYILALLYVLTSKAFFSIKLSIQIWQHVGKHSHSLSLIVILICEQTPGRIL